jgi:cytochrome P450
MLDADPPLHTALRRTVNHPFTRRAVAGYEQQVREVVTDVLDQALAQDKFDFVEQIAVRVPIRVLCRILGVPAGDEPLIVELSDKLIANTDPELTDVLFGSADSDDYRLLPFRNPAALDVHAYGRDLAAAKRRDPDTSLVSHLVNGLNGRGPLKGRDFDAMFLLLAVAGNETTRSGLSLGLDALIDHPDQWNRLRSDQSDAFLNTATAELLRYTTPLHHFRRTATRDTELGGQRIAAGDKVVVWYPSGNRDETVFAEPHRLDLARTPNPHLTFGRGGPHRCLGEHLGLLEIRIVLQELLKRVTGFERTGAARRVRSNFANGLKTLPVVVTGRP